MKKNKSILGLDLEKLIQESVQGLFEEDQNSNDMQELLAQAQAADAAKERKSAQKNKSSKDEDLDETEADPSGDPVKNSKPVAVKSDKLPDINVEAIIDKLNIIRSGFSTDKKETKNALKDYFQNLNGAERIALFAFLTGLGKVLGGSPGNEAKTPHNEPYNVDMEQEKKKKKVSKGTKDVGGDDSPIVVGERADVSSIKEKLWR